MTDRDFIENLRRLLNGERLPEKPFYSDWAWNDGNYSEGQYRDRDARMARAERLKLRGKD